MFSKVNLGPRMLPKTDQKTLQNHCFFYVLGENGFCQVCEVAFVWPSKSLRIPWKIDFFVCDSTQKRFLGHILHYFVFSCVRNCFYISLDGLFVHKEGLMGFDVSKKLIPQIVFMIFYFQSKANYGPGRGYFGPKYSFSFFVLMFFQVNVGPHLLPKTGQTILHNHWVIHDMGGNGFERFESWGLFVVTLGQNIASVCHL
jgi:hypothetical protein